MMFVTTLNASLPESTSNLPFLSRLSKIANQEPLPKKLYSATTRPTLAAEGALLALRQTLHISDLL